VPTVLQLHAQSHTQDVCAKPEERRVSVSSFQNSLFSCSGSRLLSSSATKTPFNSKPDTLEIPDDSPDLEELPLLQKLVLRFAGYHSKDSQLSRGAEKLYNEIVAQSTNDEIFAALQLENNFRGQFSVTALHIWLSLARLREEGSDGKKMSQVLYDIWWEDVQKRVRDEGVRVRVSKWLKELEEYFYGSCVAYDNALRDDPGELIDAIWRNMYGAEGGKAGAVLCSKYLRRELASLSMTSSEAILSGNIRFTRDY